MTEVEAKRVYKAGGGAVELHILCAADRPSRACFPSLVLLFLLFAVELCLPESLFVS